MEIPKNYIKYIEFYIRTVDFSDNYTERLQNLLKDYTSPTISTGNYTIGFTLIKPLDEVILNKLLQIRDYYNQGWVPDWTNDTEEKYCIINNRNTLTITVAWVANYLFVFKTKELRDEFLTNFKEDLEFIKEFL